MKKITILLLLLIGIVTLSACTNSNESKTYDGAFIKSLAKGLDARWKYNKNEKSDSASSFKKAINKLSLVAGYKLEIVLVTLNDYQKENIEYLTLPISKTKLDDILVKYLNED